MAPRSIEDALCVSCRKPTWEELEALASVYGQGFWLLDVDRFERNLEHFVQAFVRAGWGNIRAGWSYKTCWLPPLVRTAIQNGAWSEVVSRHEYELALRLGADPTKIIFNGPLKTRDDLERACCLGSMVNLDSPDEVADLVALARQHRGGFFRVGLRANVEIGLRDRGRFGLDAESGDLQQAFCHLVAEPNVAVDGLHLHISNARDAHSYSRRIERLVQLSDELWPRGLTPEYIDIGGGFCGAVPERLAQQFTTPPPRPEAYAAAIVSVLLRRWPNGGPALIVEPGIALAADSMQFAAQVGAVKTISGHRHAIVTASVYTVKPTLHDMDMPFTVIRADGKQPPRGHAIVSGWSCMERDVLSWGCPCALERGDWLLFDNCGAYTYVLYPRFIRGTPAVLARAGEDGWQLVCPADTVETWLEPFE